jgi:hypothetical protein
MDKITYKVVQPRKTNTDKTHWMEIGIGIKDGTKFALKLYTLPLPNDKGEVWCQLYERMNNDEISQKD